MEKKIKTKKMICIAFALIVFCCAMFCFEMPNTAGVLATKNVQSAFAIDDASGITTTTHIHNNGLIISKNLWNGLAKFYTANKTPEMDDISVDENGVQYLTIDLFRNFPLTTLNLNAETWKDDNKITDLTNLNYFELDSFEKIDLANNQISSVANSLKSMKNLREIDLSNNALTEFSYLSLSESCLQNLTTLNLSQNKIATCDLTGLSQGIVDLSFNELQKQNLNFPQNLDVKINLSFNYISEPDLSNSNITFGIQGIRDKKQFVIGQKIEYFGLDGIAQVEIVKMEPRTDDDDNYLKDDDGNLIFDDIEIVATLQAGEAHQFLLGYYKIKFVPQAESQTTFADMTVYICPKTPQILMFQDGKQLDEIANTVAKPTTIKFVGDEGASFVYCVNNGELLSGSEVLIDKDGVNFIKIWQIVDGYSSQPFNLYLVYEQTNAFGWVAVIAGMAIFALLFYFAIKNIGKLSRLNIGKDKKNKYENLD